MLQKNTFGKKNFKFHAPVQKCHFNHVNTGMEVKKKYTKCFLKLCNQSQKATYRYRQVIATGHVLVPVPLTLQGILAL